MILDKFQCIEFLKDLKSEDITKFKKFRIV